MFGSATLARLAPLGARALITIELVLAALFFSGLVPMLAGLATTLLLGFFALVAAIAARRGAEIDCRCFGTSADTLGSRTISRAMTLAAIAVAYIAVANIAETRWSPSSIEEWTSSLTISVGVGLLLAWTGAIAARLVSTSQSDAGHPDLVAVSSTEPHRHGEPSSVEAKA